MEKINIKDYRETVKENKLYNRALARTNLNCKALMKRIKELPRDEHSSENWFENCFRYIVWNHIIQAYNYDYNIDIIPDSACDMYGYFVRIVQREKDNSSTIAELTSGSLRLESSRGKFQIRELVYEERNLFTSVMKAMQYFEEEVINGKTADVHFVANERYLSIYQVLTMAVCMGITDEWILGGYPLPKHCLVTREGRWDHLDYFNVHLNEGKHLLINKVTGDVFDSEGKLLEYREWCDGDIGQGINSLIKLNDTEEKPIIFGASVGGYTGESFSVTINFSKETCEYTKLDYGYENKKTLNREYDEAKLNRFVAWAIRRVSNWDEKYVPEEIILDGTNWGVTIITNKRRYESCGSNAYPRDWSYFCRMVSRNIGFFA